ncbi:EcsC family protein [Streptomyces sp. NK15101]|uniref:EcsC family protein n=1 Tax=Streptomyces sp. NK15101 TaxID=2873261 RepID=UPI001CEDDD45|nr:EcsC family protein [Streptomyces sp. NK15101]
MAGDTPSRKRRLRLPGRPETHKGGSGPAEGAQEAPEAERTASLPSLGARDDERGLPASLEAVIEVAETDPARLPAGQGDARAARAEDLQGGRLGAVRRLANPARARLDRVRIGSDRIDAVRRGVTQGVRQGVKRGGDSARAGLGYLADRLIDLAPRIPVRDLATLRRQFPGLGPEELADKLVAGAANASSTVGAGVGAAAMLPVPPAMPAELAAEITGVAAVEIKLIAELHEVYGLRPPGRLMQRSAAYLTSWSEERGIDPTRPTTVNAALGGQLKRELRQQIMKRLVRNLPNLMPFMVGAAVGAVMNRRDTKRLAAHIRKDLRARQVSWDALPELPPLEQPENPEEPGF